MTGADGAPSPEDLEASVRARLRGHRLVCEVEWEPDLLSEVKRTVYDAWYRELSGLVGYGRYPATFVLYLVLVGRDAYDGEFWPHTVMGADGRAAAGAAFESALRRLNLERFPQFATANERALRFVAPILAHGGIPQTYVLPFLRDVMLPALARAEGGKAADFTARWRHRRPTGMPQPVRRYLLYGGETAADFLDRCLDLPRIGQEALRAEPAVAGLPRNVVDAFLALPAQAIAPVLRVPAPSVRIDVWSRRGPEMVLPPVGRDFAADLRWTVDDGAETRTLPASPHRETVVPLFPAGGWEGSATTGGRMVRHSFECFAESPVVTFDGEGRYVADTGSLRADQIWELLPTDVTLSCADADGTQQRLVPIDEAERPSGPWAGHRLERFDLAGVELLLVCRGEAVEYRVPVYRPGAGAEIVGVPVADVRSIDDLPVYDRTPSLSLPPWGTWNVALVGEDDAGFWTVTPAGGTRETIELATERPTFGRYEVIARGPLLGRDLRTSFVVVPGLHLDVPEEPLATGEREALVTAKAGAEIGLAGKPAGEPATLTVSAEAGSQDLWAWLGHRKTSLLVRIRVLRWGFRVADGSLELGRDGLVLDPERIGVEDVALVVTGRPGRGVWFRLEAGAELMAEESRPIVADGQATLDLGHIRDTVRDHRDRHLALTIETGSLFGLAASHVVPPPPRPRAGDFVRARVVGPDHGGLIIESDNWQALVRRFRLVGDPADYAPGTEIEGWVERDDGTLLVDARPFDPARFRLGATVRGRVVNTSDRGVVLDLGDCDGRIMADRLPTERPPASYRFGEEVEARVIDVQRRDRWFKLAVAPFDARGFQAGDVLEAKVTRTTPHAAFLDVRGLIGFVPEDEFGPRAPAAGESVRAWVVRFDHQRESVVCSLRPFNASGLSNGCETAATIVRTGPNQLTVDLPGPLRAMVLERGLPPHLIGSAERYLHVGQRITVVVTEIDPRTRWIECAYRPETYSFGPDDVGWSPFSGLVETSDE
jgi:hypothetical protein